MSKSSYQVIARVETQQFSELVGQDHVVRTLGNAIEQGELLMPIYLWGPEERGRPLRPDFLRNL